MNDRTRRILAINVIVGVVVAGAAFGIGYVTAPTPPTPTPKFAVPLSCQLAPTTWNSGTVFTAPPNACYSIPSGGINLVGLSHVVIDGGSFIDSNTRPCPYAHCAPGSEEGRPAIKVQGGSDITIENVSVTGVNRGGYDPHLAANDGIDVIGTAGVTLTDDSVSHVFGSCADFEGLRSGNGTNGVVAAVTNLVSTGLSVTACGNQAIAGVSLNGAVFDNTTIGTAGQDQWDFEADVEGVGAKNVVVNGCTDQGLVNITGGGKSMGPISISHCISTIAGSGDAVRVANINAFPMAPVTLTDDTFLCEASSHVGCLQLRGPDVVHVVGCSLHIGYPHDTLKEKTFIASRDSLLTFSGTTVAGIFAAGTHDKTSRVVNPVGEIGP